MRFTVKEASSHEWAVQLQTPTTAPVAAGDAILATFWFRTETPQEGSVGETEFVFELGRVAVHEVDPVPDPGRARMGRACRRASPPPRRTRRARRT